MGGVPGQILTDIRVAREQRKAKVEAKAARAKRKLGAGEAGAGASAQQSKGARVVGGSLSPGGVICHRCSGRGHMAADCATPKGRDE